MTTAMKFGIKNFKKCEKVEQKMVKVWKGGTLLLIGLIIFSWMNNEHQNCNFSESFQENI